MTVFKYCRNLSCFDDEKCKSQCSDCKEYDNGISRDHHTKNKKNKKAIAVIEVRLKK